MKLLNAIAVTVATASVSLITAIPAIAEDAVMAKYFDDDDFLRQDMAEMYDINPGSITSQDIDDYRSGFCLYLQRPPI